MAEPTDAQLDAIAADTGVRVARIVCWAIGSSWAAIGVVGAPAVGVWITANPTGSEDLTTILSGVAATAVGGLGLGMGLAHFLAAWGLIDGKRWAFVLAAALGGMASLGCVPVGAVLLLALLNNTTRRMFLG